jgi:hypothetical protein
VLFDLGNIIFSYKYVNDRFRYYSVVNKIKHFESNLMVKRVKMDFIIAQRFDDCG